MYDVHRLVVIRILYSTLPGPGSDINELLILALIAKTMLLPVDASEKGTVITL